MDEYQYDITCILCNTEATVFLEDVEETPAFCPMCGSEAIEVEEIELD